MSNKNADIRSLMEKYMISPSKAPKRSKDSGVTLKRDENGVLWSYDKQTGDKVGRVFDHGEGR